MTYKIKCDSRFPHWKQRGTTVTRTHCWASQRRSRQSWKRNSSSSRSKPPPNRRPGSISRNRPPPNQRPHRHRSFTRPTPNPTIWSPTHTCFHFIFDNYNMTSKFKLYQCKCSRWSDLFFVIIKEKSASRKCAELECCNRKTGDFLNSNKWLSFIQT